MNKADYQNTVVSQIRELNELVEIEIGHCFDPLRWNEIFPVEKATGIKRVIATGCGDSYAAAGAMAEAFRKISGLKTYHHPDPMELIRYYTDFDLTKGYSKEETLVIAISASGGKDMIREILERANGCHSLLVTNNPETANAEYAESVFDVRMPSGCDVPGLRSYFSSMIALLGLASYLGKANGHFSEAEEQDLISEIRDYVHRFMKDFEKIDELMLNEAVRMKDLNKFEIVADWSDTWSALFVEQKFIECSGIQATHINSEEWVHISMMYKDPEKIGDMYLITKDSNSYGRIVDSSWGSVQLKRPTIIVTDGAREDFEEDLTFVSLTKAPRTYLAPLMNFIPGSLLAGYHAAINGRLFFQNRYDYRTNEWKD